MGKTMFMTVFPPSSSVKGAISSKTTDLPACQGFRLCAKDFEGCQGGRIQLVWEVCPILVRRSSINYYHQVKFSSNRLDTRQPPEVKRDQVKGEKGFLSFPIKRSACLAAKNAVFTFSANIFPYYLQTVNQLLAGHVLYHQRAAMCETLVPLLNGDW